jgi:hypothetical protein
VATLNYEKSDKNKQAERQGTSYKATIKTMPDDPIVEEEMEFRKQQEQEQAERAVTFNAHLKIIGVDKATYKRLNREFKALRLAGKTLLSYNEWMREKIEQRAP